MAFRQIDVSQISTTNSSNTQVMAVVNGNVSYVNSNTIVSSVSKAVAMTMGIIFGA
jgi:hypothetical protein